MKKILSILFALMLCCSAALAEDAPAAPFTIYPPKAASAVFSFDANPTTGYTWSAFLLKEGVVTLTSQEGEYTPAESQEEALGQGGIHSFEITAAAPGETIILFHSLRAWEGKPEKTLAYLVTVDENGALYVQDLEGTAPLTGEVISIDAEEGTALIKTETHNEVLARFPADMPLPALNESISIWFNGVMTLSLPGQINVIAWETIAPEQARAL